MNPIEQPVVVFQAFGSGRPDAMLRFAQFHQQIAHTLQISDDRIYCVFTSPRVRPNPDWHTHWFTDPAKALSQAARQTNGPIIGIPLTATPTGRTIDWPIDQPHRLRCGRPLFANRQDTEQLYNRLRADFIDQALNLIIFHGSHRFNAHRQTVRQLQQRCDDQPTGHAAVACIEGPPTLDAILQTRHQADQPVHLIPMLFTAGYHVHHDLNGDGSLSWRQQLGQASVTIAPTLLEQQWFLQLTAERITELMSCND